MLRSLRARVLAGYGLVLLLVAVVLAVALGTTSRLGVAGDALLRRNYASIRAADGMGDAAEQMDRGALLTRAGNPAGRPQTAAHADSFRVWFGRAAANVTEPGERATIARLGAAFRAYRALALGPATLGPAEPGTAGRSMPELRAVQAAVVRLRAINQTAMVAASARTRADARRAFRLTLGVGLAALAAGLAFSLALASALVRPLGAMRAAAEAIGRGRYDVDLPAPTDDDLGGLARAMAAMARALRDYDAINVDRLLAEKRKTDAVLQAMDDGLVVVDAGMRVAAANPAAEGLLGALAPGRLLDDAVADAQLVTAVRDALADGYGPPPDAPARFVADAADRRHVQYVVSVLGGPPGGAPAAIVLLRDLTRLREAERAKSAFLQATSHELRTPLTGLEMALGMLQGPVAERLDARDQDLFAIARDEQRRLTGLVASLLDLARMEAGEAALDLEPLDVRALLARTAARFEAQASVQGVAVAVASGPPLTPVLADAARLELVLSNLVSNALRYVGPGGHVTLSASAGAGAPGAVEIAVEDDGPGVPPEWQERIFEPLAQVEGRLAGASGLGLSICRAVAEAHGGSIRVETSPAGGALFVVALPVQPQA